MPTLKQPVWQGFGKPVWQGFGKPFGGGSANRLAGVRQTRLARILIHPTLTSALLVIGISGYAWADDFPKRRDGLWEIQSDATRSAGLDPVQQCVGPDSDTATEHLDRTIGRRGYCNLSPFVRNDNNVWIAQSTCRHRRKVVITRKIATGDFRTQYRIDTIVRSQRKRRTRTLVQDILQARYLGPCLAGQRPGDLITPGMGTLNMTDGAFRRESSK